ncbi:hypothetical protein C900_05911 [Fulvivirga imtechensis AK7]|uniref:Uncharacterized protein n=1 Tax=Fulvivirga imtechensis AK7 TaxID=1237149 RepID=L8JKH5_9BACT|nr:DUF5713 family protein [Fulvivirga imtechensis]ELR68728.1 hypothetical protein C900_05911 [Fulvivirga imtechensis AK7]
MIKDNSGPINSAVGRHVFIKHMYDDDYFPKHLVDKGKIILLDLCLQIEQQAPNDLKDLYVLTHVATKEFNDLQEEFYEHGSELETVARESIGADFKFVAAVYGFEDADIEELIMTREW